MRRPRLWLALIVLTALVATGCGGSSTPKASSVAVSTSTSTPSATAAPPATTTTTPAKTTTTKKPTTTTTAPAKTTTTAPATSTASTTTPLPVTPAGLKAAAGYSSYDGCKGTCSGSVPASLRRALHLPSLGAGGACPVSRVASAAAYAGPAVGPGPVYAAQPTPFAVASFIGSAWKGGRVTWVAAPSYTGPVLIRGGQVGGAGQLGFGVGQVPVDELQLLTPAATSGGEPSGAREWPSVDRVRQAGCYAYQVDGTTFSEVIVFQATG